MPPRAPLVHYRAVRLDQRGQPAFALDALSTEWLHTRAMHPSDLKKLPHRAMELLHSKPLR